jgi:transcriptional regulator with XRE-family HTH domain
MAAKLVGAGGAMKMQERIRRARRRVGLSQAGLAAAIDVRRSAVSNWESADVLPSMQNLLAIAKACRVSLEWLGTGRGGISTDPEAAADVPAADAELVDVEEERILLAGFRDLPRRSQQLVLDLVETLQSGRRRAGRV